MKFLLLLLLATIISTVNHFRVGSIDMSKIAFQFVSFVNHRTNETYPIDVGQATPQVC